MSICTLSCQDPGTYTDNRHPTDVELSVAFLLSLSLQRFPWDLSRATQVLQDIQTLPEYCNHSFLLNNQDRQTVSQSPFIVYGLSPVYISVLFFLDRLLGLK